MSEGYRMFTRRRGLLAACGLVVSGTLLVTWSPGMAQIQTGVPANAQPQELSLEEASARLARAGFTDIVNLRRRGGYVTADAIAANGLRAKIVLHSVSGDILGLRLMAGADAAHLDATAHR